MYTDSVSNRFERSVDRTGEHHIWTGAIDAVRGTGRLKVRGKNVTAHRVAWEIANGELAAGARVLACPEEPACVRLDHLRLDGVATTPGPRNRKGGGSMREVRLGVWKLSATARFADRTTRRVHRTVHADGRTRAAKDLASLVDEVDKEDGLVHREHSRMTVDEAIEVFLSEHLAEEKGREGKTIRDYRALHRKWFAQGIGNQLVREVDKASLDRLFGAMRRAGLSASRMNLARSLYAPFFRWTRERGMTTRDPMANFQLPTSQYVSRERTPPEVEELSVLLAEAVAVVPDVAPVLVLGATSGMRRGELVGVRRSRIDWAQRRITVDAAIDGKRVKGTKTRKERSFYVDDETMALMQRLCEQRDQPAAAAGVALDPDPFLFSLALDCSQSDAPRLRHQTRRSSQGAPRVRGQAPRDCGPRAGGAPALPLSPREAAARQDGPSTEGRPLVSRNRGAPRPKRALGGDGRRLCAATRGRQCPHDRPRLRRLDSRPAQVHVERAPRRRL